MLALPALAEVDALVALVTRALVDAAHFGAVDRDALLLRDGVDADALAVLEKAWRKKGRAVAQQIAARHPLDAAALAQTPVLADTNWRLHVELGQSKVRGQTDPAAIFQLTLQDPNDAQQVEIGSGAGTGMIDPFRNGGDCTHSPVLRCCCCCV